MTDVAAVQRLTDRAELQDLVNRYALAVDDHNLATVREMFTRDATFLRRGSTAHGRETVLRSLERSMRRYGPTIHTPHLQLIDWIDDDNATGVATGHAELALSGTLMVAAYRYHDTYRRDGGRWRFAKRELLFLYGTPAADFSTAFADPLRLRWPDEPPSAADLPESVPTWSLGAPPPESTEER
jgi:ketosteroid isomerase-like protein